MSKVSSERDFLRKLLHQMKCLQSPGHLSYEAHLALNHALFSEIEPKNETEKELLKSI